MGLPGRALLSISNDHSRRVAARMASSLTLTSLAVDVTVLALIARSLASAFSLWILMRRWRSASIPSRAPATLYPAIPLYASVTFSARPSRKISNRFLDDGFLRMMTASVPGSPARARSTSDCAAALLDFLPRAFSLFCVSLTDLRRRTGALLIADTRSTYGTMTVPASAPERAFSQKDLNLESLRACWRDSAL